MSGVCIVNLKNYNLNFRQLNEMSNRLVRLALKTKSAVFFNSCDYCEELIKSESMKNYFLMSDSFLYKNCDFLNTAFITDVTDIDKSWKQFKKKFRFFDKYLKIIFSYKVENLEMFISNEFFDEVDETITVKKVDFLQQLFRTIYNYADKYAFGFPPIKFVISN